jgi:hypothetical protein
MNTQDSDDDVLFRQDRRYRERGAGGFASGERADGRDQQVSLPVQPPEGVRYPQASELSRGAGGA